MSEEIKYLEDGSAQFLLDGKLHREGGPAICRVDGKAEEWYLNGKRHRVDGPAVLNEDGTKEWYFEGKRHRKRGPAVERENGLGNEWWVFGIQVTEEEFNNPNLKISKDGVQIWENERGEIHREDGPAIIFKPSSIWPEGREDWYHRGLRHRVDGPAIKFGDVEEWYIQGENHREGGPAIISKNHAAWFRYGKYHREDGPAVIDRGKEYWYLNGERHRIGGPAFIDGNYKEWWVEGEKLTEQQYAEKYPILKIDIDGTQRWLLKNKHHREDGPAIIFPDGSKKWYFHGELHREDGPAVENKDGLREWRKNGELHREDGPAFIDQDGTKQWFLNGERHRKDGPAVIWTSGDKEWWLHGKCHRTDGPAIDYVSGHKAWYIEGQSLSEQEFYKKYPHREMDRWGNVRWYKDGKFHREDGPAIEYNNGTKHWYQHGKLHREDGPAITADCGNEEWWLNDQEHREDGPAIVLKHINKWYKHGKLHRIGGPAIEYKTSAGGKLEWWVEGQQLSEEEYRSKYPIITVYPDGIISWSLKGIFHREDGPAVIHPDGTKQWYLNGEIHRDDGPAFESPNGDKEWWKHGNRHREDGPAIEFHNGDVSFYLEGELLSRADFELRKQKKEELMNLTFELKASDFFLFEDPKTNSDLFSVTSGIPSTPQEPPIQVTTGIREVNSTNGGPSNWTREQIMQVLNATHEQLKFINSVKEMVNYVAEYGAINPTDDLSKNIENKKGYLEFTTVEVEVMPKHSPKPTTRELLQGKVMLEAITSSMVLPLSTKAQVTILPYLKLILPVLLERFLRDRHPKLARLSEHAFEAQLLTLGMKVKDEFFDHLRRSFTQSQVTEAFQGYVDVSESIPLSAFTSNTISNLLTHNTKVST